MLSSSETEPTLKNLNLLFLSTETTEMTQNLQDDLDTQAKASLQNLCNQCLLEYSQRISSSPHKLAEDSATVVSWIGQISSLVEAARYIVGILALRATNGEMDGNITLL